MAQTPLKSVIVVGGGIVGLTIAVAAQGAGHSVTLISRDRPEDTASGVAAGMIAPVLEARTDPYDRKTFSALKAAQAAWLDLIDLWPEHVRALFRQQEADARNIYVWRGEMIEDDSDFFSMRQSRAEELSPQELGASGIATGLRGIGFKDDWLVDGLMLLSLLKTSFVTQGGHVHDADVFSVSAHRARLNDDTELAADAVIVAAGYESLSFADQVTSLTILQPIKGHLLDLFANGPAGIIRSSEAYLANHGSSAKFGATMEAGRDDTRIDAAQVEGLKERARTMLPRLDLSQAVPRVGIRAASPDGWPMIGRDRASGVLVATAMRRNGYVFAPLAARMMLGFLAGKTPPEAAAYDPNRFG